MNSNYKDLFLGIRQYDSNLSNETLNRLIEIAYTAPNNKSYPGYQNTDLFELGEISIDLSYGNNLSYGNYGNGKKNTVELLSTS